MDNRTRDVSWKNEFQCI